MQRERGEKGGGGDRQKDRQTGKLADREAERFTHTGIARAAGKGSKS
jgi:hypothetical protein